MPCLLRGSNFSVTLSGMETPATRLQLTDERDICAGLVRQIALKSEDALAKLYDRTSSVVYALALRILRERSLAEDTTQEVYLQVWRMADAFDPARGTVLTWLVTLTRSRSFDRLRSTKARRSREVSSDTLDTFSDSRPSPEQVSSESERAGVVHNLLSRLPLDQRAAIEQAYFSGLSHSEIASRTGLPLGTIKTRIRYGMKQLREQLMFHMESGRSAIPRDGSLIPLVLVEATKRYEGSRRSAAQLGMTARVLPSRL
jgi:RNA polymerase sigma-70 factor (ECF subfamily)